MPSLTLQDIFPFVFIAILAILVIYIVKSRGVRNAVFGAKKLVSVGELEGRKRFGVKSLLRVHKVTDSKSGDELVGLELVQRSVLSFSMQPFSMSKDQARELTKLLESAVDDDT